MIADPWIRALKIFVLVAGILVLLGTGTLAWLLVTGAVREPASRPAAAPPQPTGPGASAPIVADLPLPAGAAILDLVSDPERIVLLLRTPGGQDYLAWIDPATGARRALLRIVPEGP